MELRKYFAIAKRWWWLGILFMLASAVTSYAVSQRQVPVYEATTTLMVGQSLQAVEVNVRDFQTIERMAQTYADMARRQPVLQAVAETLNLKNDWKTLKKRVRSEPLEGTQLLAIRVEAGSAEEARATADEIARQLILLSPAGLQDEEQENQRRFVSQRLGDLQAKIEAGQVRVGELESAMAGSLSAQQVQDIQGEINTLEGLIADWENSYTQLLIFIDSKRSPNYLAVIEPAQANHLPVRPNIKLDTLIGGAVGLLLALGLVFLLEYLDDTLKSADEISQLLGLFTLGSVTRIKGKDYQGKLLAAQGPFSPVAEAFRMIRSNIQFISIDRPIKSIVVTSAAPGEGKSITVANLGIVIAQAGLKTIILDTDLRRPVQHQIFTMPNKGGLTDLLRSPELDFNSYLRNTGIENLQLITCGTLPPNPAELLGSQRMVQLLAGLDDIADVVLCDSPPAAAVTDAAVLSSQVDGVVLVIEAGQTRREIAKQAMVNLQQAGVNLLGVVLNRASRKRGGYYYYYTSHKRRPAGRPGHSRQQRLWHWLPLLKGR